jgi:hypothetical protein
MTELQDISDLVLIRIISCSIFSIETFSNFTIEIFRYRLEIFRISNFIWSADFLESFELDSIIFQIFYTHETMIFHLSNRSIEAI